MNLLSAGSLLINIYLACLSISWKTYDLSNFFTSSEEESSEDSRRTIWLILSANMLYCLVSKPIEVIEFTLRRDMNFYKSSFLSISIYAFSISRSYFAFIEFLGRKQLTNRDFISDFDYIRLTWSSVAETALKSSFFVILLRFCKAGFAASDIFWSFRDEFPPLNSAVDGLNQISAYVSF